VTKSKMSFALAGAGKSGRDIVDNIGRRARRH
jgi:hypothetical protein